MGKPADAAAESREVVVIGAGVIGCAIAWALGRAGWRVRLLDRAEPAAAGASFGNVGHIATEQLVPLPAPRWLVAFWRELYAFGGPLDIPVARVGVLAPWLARFALAAFKQRSHARLLAPMVLDSARTLDAALTEIGRRELLRRNGHYALWMGRRATQRADAASKAAAALGVRVERAPGEMLERARQMRESPTASLSSPLGDGRALERVPHAHTAEVCGLWYPDSAHVVDPAAVARAFAAAAVEAGASIERRAVRTLRPQERTIALETDGEPLIARTVVVCAGAWSAPLLRPFGLHAPLEAERGYHVEIVAAALTQAPVLYADHSLVVTPMAGRLRASSFLEFAGLGAAPDARKPRRLRATLRTLGYACDADGPSWMGPRPTLPDYLPAIGRAATGHELYYAVGHQHLGLTLAAVTAEIVTDLVDHRRPRFDVAGLDLRRFGRP